MMKFIRSWLILSVLGFLVLTVLAVLGHGFDWMNTVIGSVLLGLLLTWTVHPMMPKDFLGQHR